MRTAAAVALAALALSISACGGEEKSSNADQSGGSSDSSVSQDDRMIIEPIEAIGATKVEIGSDDVRAHFEGSVDEITASTPCLAVETVIGDKAAILVYEDGEVTCADRHAE